MILIMLIATLVSPIQKDHLATQFEKAYQDQKVAKEMIHQLEESKNRSPRETAYLGAFNMLMANHSNNPFSKLAYFQEGKSWISEAVNEDSKHIEIRYLRFMNQVETPKVLGYKEEIAEDKELILSQLDHYKGSELYDTIVKYLKHCSALSQEEKSKL